MNENTLVIALLGFVLVAINTMHFFVMSDIRDRILRLEKMFFENRLWDGDERREKANG